jgi:hypothetical protein
VRNEDDRNAATLQIAHEIEEIFLLFGGQTRGGFVEDDDLGLMQHRARDFDHLLLGSAEHSDRRRRRHVEIERLQELLRGDVDAAQSIVEPFLAQEQVLRHRHRGNETVLLKHHRDAQMARLQRRSRRDGSAVDDHGARSQRHHAGHDLRQSRLARPVLADERMNLAAAQLEIHTVDRRHLRIEFGRFAKLENIVAQRPISASSPASGKRSRRPGPLART